MNKYTYHISDYDKTAYLIQNGKPFLVLGKNKKIVEFLKDLNLEDDKNLQKN